MLKNILAIVVFTFSLGGISAQTFTGKLNPFPSNNPVKITSGDTLKILGVMADFPEDNDGTTFGNGKFGSIYSENYGDDILDPLPHNKEYFEAHLEFVKNYYKKVSNENVIIEYEILPDTFTVSQTMRNYSPPNNSDDFTPLGNYAEEVWQQAVQVFPNFNFNEYDVFTIFHAGVGRDISLPGSFGNENDLPSVYLSLKSLQNIFGNNFNGFPANNGSVISNTMIIPETESRELESIGGTVLFEITINGLLVASIASHLGLPDLFDTETGLSAIGRFGLMDGQSIFAYNGAFPPEPSAWEKLYLGWDTSEEISPGNYSNLSLTANEIAGLMDTTILKVPLNSSEYYLVENRIRDVNSDGATVTYILNNDTLSITLEKDTTGFRSFDVDTLSGVIIDIDEFDWALPGNGIVIWHIDENIIAANIDNNTINNNEDNRGVDVEEADGVQDIGVEFTTILGDIVIGEGTELDFWYSGNEAELYQNKFTKNTRPNTKTNTGANSLISFTDFSPIANKMSFNISYGDSIVNPIFARSIFSIDNYTSLKSLPDNNGFVLSNINETIITDNKGIIERNFSDFTDKEPITFENGGTTFIAGTKGNLLNVFMKQDTLTYFSSVDVGEMITSHPVLQVNSSNELRILLGTENGNLLTYSTGNYPATDPVLLNSTNISGQNNQISKIAVSTDKIVVLTNEINSNNYSIYQDGNLFHQINTTTTPSIGLTKNRTGDFVVVLKSVEKLFAFENWQIKTEKNVNTSITNFSIGDLKQDGENYIIYSDDKNINAVNISGASATNFPISDPQGIGFDGVPLVADIEGDNKAEVIAKTVDGRIFAIDGGTGKVVPGFPLSSGSPIFTSPVIYVADGKISLASLNGENYFSGWKVGSTEGTIFWGDDFGNNFNTSFVDAASSVNYVNEFFPENRVYNYPNPVYDGVTYIRYYVSEDSEINIKIFDLAGDLVDELNDNAAAGLDNETEWNVTGIQSGIYLARIEATGSSGKTESKIIKIAVVK